jgi:peptidyl-prolyl cis-trans isomerase A (cyclophilin A)/peptidyl-prolyl cis-trans isomerase B (cyclophilin B)
MTRTAYFLLTLLVLEPAVSLAATPTIAEIQTNLGTITIQLSDKAPITVANFISYASKAAYDHTLFHRTIKDFVIQGGGFDAQTGYPIATAAAINNEANNGLKNVTGSIAMAMTDKPNSATSQFFINLADNSFLDYGSTQNPNGYAVFGHVLNGYNVAKAIGDTNTRDFSDNNCTNKGKNYCGGLYSALPITGNNSLLYVERVYLSDAIDTKNTTVRVITDNTQGKVISSPSGIKCGVSPNICSTKKKASSTKKITLTATPLKNYIFSGWSGDCRGYKPVISLELKSNHNCTATFVKATL